MSESSRTTTDGRAGETLNVEDLFATDDTDIAIDDGDDDTDAESAKPGTQTTTAAAEDTTAGEVFAQLRADHDDDTDGEPVDTVSTESPEDIVARADEETEHVDQIDDAIRAEAGALDDLLLTERREADGFLWVETEADGRQTTADADGDDVPSLFESSGTADATEAAAGATDAAAGATDETDDEFSLDHDTEDSFEARAASFDDVDDAFDGAATEDGTASTDANDETTPESATESSKSDASDDESGGLASRIRSILS